jgi:hypothetical protein
MAPVLAPGQVGQELLCCLGLGLLVGLVRLVLPTGGANRRGKRTKLAKYSAIAADFLAVGFVCLLVQAYAAGASYAGGVRWYMLAGAALGAGAVQQLLGPAARRVRAAGGRFAGLVHARYQRLVGQRLHRAWERAKQKPLPGKTGRAPEELSIERENGQKILAKNDKKILQTPREVLYNSCV